MVTESKFQANKIKDALSELGSIYSEIRHLNDIDDKGELIYQISSRKDNFEFIALRLYNLCTAYFEFKNLPKFLSRFEEIIKPFYKDKSTLISGAWDDYNEEDCSSLIAEVWQFLAAFPEFESEDDEIINQRLGLTYLEHILDSTAIIIKDSNTKVTSEHQVYKAVKLVTKATFVDVEFPTESFQKKAKCYIPDILIPSLNCAIEYKYATDEKTLIKTIDEILIDVQGYSKHPTYKIFYAVFYIKSGIWTKKRFNEVWKEKEFPKNWKWVFVEGA